MKHLIFLFIFSASLTACSQVADSLLKNIDALIARCKKMSGEMDEYERKNPWFTGAANHRTPPKPDTLRAIILVTLSPNGVARSRMGYVVIEQGNRPVYLDCRKRALKLPQVGWGWIEVGLNEKKK